MAHTPTVASLARRARKISATWEDVERDACAFDNSAYQTQYGPRCWSNWLIKGKLLIGQYPYSEPRAMLDKDDARLHLRAVLTAGTDCFVCVQQEVPPQDEPQLWLVERRSRWLLCGSSATRSRRPPLDCYAEDAEAIAREVGCERALSFLHIGIVDGSTPRGGIGDGAPLLLVLELMLMHYEDSPTGAMYVHCRAGQGRAGMVGGCMLALMRPELSEDQVLAAVQAGFDSRAGTSAASFTHLKSPQTQEQCNVVRRFVRAMKRASPVEDRQVNVRVSE